MDNQLLSLCEVFLEFVEKAFYSVIPAYIFSVFSVDSETVITVEIQLVIFQMEFTGEVSSVRKQIFDLFRICDFDRVRRCNLV